MTQLFFFKSFFCFDLFPTTYSLFSAEGKSEMGQMDWIGEE